MTTWIKFCGCTSWNDVEMAIEAGADAIGMIFAPSARRISLQAAAEIAEKLPSTVTAVSVFVDPTPVEVVTVRKWFPHGLMQFSGSESAEFVLDAAGDRGIKTFHLGFDDRSADIEAACAIFPSHLILFDAKHQGMAGGTGRTFPWQLVAPVVRRRQVIVAGGLDPDNVAECVRSVRPYGVDVRSGIETQGRKDVAKMRAFVRAVRTADEA